MSQKLGWEASLEGPYEVIAELASGGMATTYLARKTGQGGFERLVVVKRVHPHLAKEPALRDALRDEARLGAAIHHPNVVPVEDVVDAGGELCLVMPYVESLSLGALLARAKERSERVPAAIASRVVLDVLAGLDAAHEAKDLRGEPLEIVHRDVSPRNVLVATDGQGKLIDFGVAMAARRISQTQSGIMKGTLSFMSPEQLRRRELDRRADVFAAGAVLYEALTGERLFDGRDEADVLLGVLADEVPSVAERIEGGSAAIDDVLARALARDREERFPSAAAFAEALERALPPAPAREVSELVERLGAEEIASRREAIRVYLDRTARAPAAAPSSEAEPQGLEATNPRADKPRGLGFGLVIAIVAIVVLAAMLRARTQQASVSLPPATSATSSSTESATEPPREAPPARATAPAALASDPKRVELAPTIRASARAPEKTDKTRPEPQENFYRSKELQDNPYR